MSLTNPTARTLLAVAAGQVSQFPQYDAAYWARFQFVVEFTQDVRTKMGLAFRKGDRAVAYVAPLPAQVEELYRLQGDTPPVARWTAWSIRNRIATSVPVDAFHVVAEVVR